MKTLRMITCFLITCMFVFLLLIPGKAQASETDFWDGIWAVEVQGRDKNGTIYDFCGTWIVGVEHNYSLRGACTWIGCSDFVDSLAGTLLSGGQQIRIERRYSSTQNDADQTYESDNVYWDDDKDLYCVEGTWSGEGCSSGVCSWKAYICKDRLEIPDPTNRCFCMDTNNYCWPPQPDENGEENSDENGEEN